MLYERLLPPPERSFFLFGMKGIGKFNWTRQTLPQALHVDTEDAKIASRLNAEPELLNYLVQSVGPGQWVVVHELHQIPSLLTHVYRQIEEHGLKFALLSSNIHRLKAEHSQDLMSGRIHRVNMHPLAPAELGAPLDIEEVLRYGTISTVWDAADREAMLNHVNSTAQLYMREEIRSQVTLQTLNGFVQFVPIAARLHGQSISSHDIAQNYDLKASDVELYLKILEDSMVISQLDAFNPKMSAARRGSKSAHSQSKKAKKAAEKREKKKKRKARRLSKRSKRYRPKLYWIDPGLVRSVGNKVGPVVAEERKSLLEGWMLGVLRTHNDYQGLYDHIAYWTSARSVNTVEFLITRNEEHLAIAVQDVDEYTPEAFKGLHSIAKLTGLTRRVAVYTGSETRKTDDGVEVWPVEIFGEALANSDLWP